MYRTTKQSSAINSAYCDECKSTRIRIQQGSLICDNCGHKIHDAKKRNKYNASPMVGQDGIRRDSKFESSIADELRIRVKAKDIKGYDSQYRVDIPLYDDTGFEVMKVRHKVDFRIHHNDGSFELLEAKGIETDDYKWRRKFLENFWLPKHKDHIYTVRYGSNHYKGRSKS